VEYASGPQKIAVANLASGRMGVLIACCIRG